MSIDNLDVNYKGQASVSDVEAFVQHTVWADMVFLIKDAIVSCRDQLETCQPDDMLRFQMLISAYKDILQMPSRLAAAAKLRDKQRKENEDGK